MYFGTWGEIDWVWDWLARNAQILFSGNSLGGAPLFSAPGAVSVLPSPVAAIAQN
jgi:hypothetical protein